MLSHPTMGAWIEILGVRNRGVKTTTSHPTMGAWIEIEKQRIKRGRYRVAPHDGCVDWNMGAEDTEPYPTESHPTMGAWIEMI